MATTTTEQMTIDRIAHEIRRAYGTHTTQTYPGAWMSGRYIAEHTGLTPEQIKAGILHLAQTDLRCNVIPESAQHTMTQLDWDLAAWYGGQWVSLICWS
ncbi:hypothetical protein AB0L22_09105 [Micromonospora haikouensis]|uniref:hypothetical protein n=1 Tax=Micromonospora haikouensis TaxID=686309 RepID=UPI003437B47C